MMLRRNLPSCPATQQRQASVVHVVRRGLQPASGGSILTAYAVSTQQFLEDCSGLGQIRFIVVGDGAIIESVSEFARLRYTKVASRGTLATVSTADASFECHLVLNKIKQVRLAKTKARNGDWDVYAVRFVGDEDKVLLTAALHGQQGQYDASAVERFKELQDRYGESCEVEEREAEVTEVIA